MRKFVSRSAAETKRFSRTVLGELMRSKSRPVVLALCGELGSGKTTFVQGVASALGIRGRVQSPTFVIAKWYALGSRQPFRRILHLDAYRIQTRDVRHLGLARAFRDRDTLVVIEWAERIKRLIPHGAVWIQFRHTATRGRIISVNALPLSAQSRKTKARAAFGVQLSAAASTS